MIHGHHGEDSSANWSDGSKQKIEAIFQILHEYLVPDTAHANSGSLGYFGAEGDSISKKAMDDATQSLLHRCLYALGRGETVSEQQNKGPKWTNLLCKTFAASQIISHLSDDTHSKSPLKRAVCGQLLAYGASKFLWKVLSKLGVSPSSEFARIGDVNQSMQNLTMGLDYDPHDLLLLLYDNLGFCRAGSNPGYDQYTAMQIAKVPKEDLQKWKVYPQVAGGPCLSRARKDWAAVRGEVSFHDVLGVTSNDVNILARSVLAPVKMLLQMEAEGGLPTYEEAKEMVSEKGKAVTWPTKILQELGVRKIIESDPTSSSNINTRTSHVAENDLNNVDQTYATNLDANQSTVDLASRKLSLHSSNANAESTPYTTMLYLLQKLSK